VLGWGSADGRVYWGLHLRYYYFEVEGHLQQEHGEAFAGGVSDGGRAANDHLGSCIHRRHPRCEQDCENGNDPVGRHVHRRSEGPRRLGTVGSQRMDLRETFRLERRICQPKG
jgi:hypothetical protein